MICKFPLVKNQKLPSGSAFLHAGPDPRGNMCIWVDCDPEQPPAFSIVVAVTGGNSPPGGEYLTTVVEGMFVLHYFLVRS